MRYRKLISGIILAAVIAAFTGCGDENTAETNTSADDSSVVQNAEEPDEDGGLISADDSLEDSDIRDTAESTPAGSEVSSAGGKNASDTKTSVKSGGNSKSKTNSKTTAKKSGNKAASKTTAKKSGSKSTVKATTAKKKSTTAPKKPEPTEADDTIRIKLNGSGASSGSNSGVSISGSTVTISSEGKYEFSGNLDNGQIIVNADKSSKVDIYFNGVNINCNSSAPLYVMSADTCSLHLAEGTSNSVQDTASNALSACIFSKDDLTIKGSGSLSVYGNKKHGIKSSNDVKIKNGSIYISCPSTGVYGEDSVQISGGSVSISSCKDGIKASNEEDSSRGYVTVEDGYIDVQNAAGNGIQAVSGITVSGGKVKIHSEKKAVNCDNTSIASGCLSEY